MSNTESRIKIKPRGFCPRGSGIALRSVLNMTYGTYRSYKSYSRRPGDFLRIVSFLVEGDEILRRHFVEIAFGHDGVSVDAVIQLLIEAFFVEIRFGRGDCAGGGRGHHLFYVA